MSKKLRELLGQIEARGDAADVPRLVAAMKRALYDSTVWEPDVVRILRGAPEPDPLDNPEPH